MHEDLLSTRSLASILSAGMAQRRPVEETNDPLHADRRNFYEVEKWSRDGQRVEESLFARNAQQFQLTDETSNSILAKKSGIDTPGAFALTAVALIRKSRG
jgi:hypothetical protein